MHVWGKYIQKKTTIFLSWDYSHKKNKHENKLINTKTESNIKITI